MGELDFRNPITSVGDLSRYLEEKMVLDVSHSDCPKKSFVAT